MKTNKNKKVNYFTLYQDQKHIIDTMTDEEAGQFLKELFHYLEHEEYLKASQMWVILIDFKRRGFNTKNIRDIHK